jgi:surfactin synthase thioesterase subunit
MTSPSDSFRLLRAAAGPRLVMFPHSGAGALSMAAWAADLPVTVECCAIQRPGREDSFAEPPLASLRACVDAACDALALRMDRPYALFGHSLGGFLAFQVAAEVHVRGLPPPVALFVSAISPVVQPQARQASREARRRQMHASFAPEDAPDDDLIDELLLAGDVAFEADLSLYFDSIGQASDATLDLPIVAIYACDDALAPREVVAGWARHTCRPLTMLPVSGDHFYVSTPARRPVAEAIARVLLPHSCQSLSPTTRAPDRSPEA